MNGNRSRRPAAGALALLAALTAAGADEAVRRDPGRHVHGTATLDIALEGRTLQVELDGPAVNFLGFEHAPRTAAERTRLGEVRAALSDAATLVGLPAAAGCRLAQAEYHLPTAAPEQAGHDDHGHDDDHDEGHDGDRDIHSDVSARWTFDCAQPQQLTRLTPGLFDVFPLLEHIEVALVTPDDQTRRVIDRTRPDVPLDTRR